MSKTFIIIWDVPDFGGLPPSTAVRVMVITGCFSRTLCNIQILQFGRKQWGIVIYI
uniref:Uncharacterized protein n=1 Tax=Lates calcarifer TaxID=8187 RepID=A0A4W6BMG2_LATCA